MPPAVGYAPRFDVVDLIQRGLTTTLACSVYRDGELAVPTDGTVTVYDGSGTEVDSGSVIVTSGVATFSLAGATTASLDLGRGWRIEWVLTMPDGVDHTFVAEAGLVRCVPAPVISNQALYARVPALDPRGPGQPLTKRQSYQTFIDDAWIRLRNDLDAMDRRVELVVSPQALREPHLLLTLGGVFGDLAARNPAHQGQADGYIARYEAALARAVLVLDTDADGVADTAVPARPPVFLV